jgi:hypothetical protein
MSKTRVWITGCCLFSLALAAGAQANRKPGLWEITTDMTWQQSPMPAGMTMPGGGPHTQQVCLTQAMIDKYGAPMPQNRDCQVSNVVMKAAGMTADWVCSGRMVGKGTLESSWAVPDHAKGKVHFVGTIPMGANSRTIEYTIDSSSVFKGSDCGSVKPPPMPDK